MTRRRLRPLVAALAGAALLLGCAPSPSAVPSSAPAGSATATVSAGVDEAAVLTAVAAAGAAAGGSVTVVVLDAAGEALVTGADAAAPEYTASLVKLLVVARLLELDAGGALELTTADLGLMRRAVERSDDDAMSTLWARYDGAALVTAVARDLGLPATAPPAEAGQWGQATASAADVATFLAALDDLAGQDGAATLRGWMAAAQATAADGFDQQFGLLSGGAGTVAAKQGWMCCVDDRRQLHSAGVLADGGVVVLLGDFPATTTWAAAAGALDASAAAVLAAA